MLGRVNATASFVGNVTEVMIVKELLVVFVQILKAIELVLNTDLHFKGLHTLSKLSERYTVVVILVKEAECSMHMLESLINADPDHL